jgi:voltage-gated potassium channel
MGALGLVFVLVVLGQSIAGDRWLGVALSVLGWLLWSVFVAEFALRAYLARDQRRFWARNWWQVVFLAVPFLRFARALTLLRAGRVGALSSLVRGSRSAARLLSGRLGWLGVVTGVVVLASSQLLYVLGAYSSYADALHDAALATVTGEPLSAAGGVARTLEVVLAVYSVAVFATLAGALGAFFLQRPNEPAAMAGPDVGGASGVPRSTRTGTSGSRRGRRASRFGRRRFSPPSLHIEWVPVCTAAGASVRITPARGRPRHPTTPGDRERCWCSVYSG